MEVTSEQTAGMFPLNHDFIDEANFDQFIHLIRGDNEIEPYSLPNLMMSNQVYNDSSFDHQNGTSMVDLGDCLANGQLFSPPPAIHLFDFNAAENDHVGNIDELLMEETESSGTRKKSKSCNVDRSRTIVSERKRRGRMKEKLYALRSLVPNITKMDKASIVGDAVLYVQNLQMQARKLRAEIQLIGSSDDQISNRLCVTTSFYPIMKKIFKMEVVQVEERGFYVRVESNKGKGVAISIYEAIEALRSFIVQTSNLDANGENYAFMFTLHIMEGEMEVSVSSLKLWIASAFLNQGFEFETSPLS